MTRNQPLFRAAVVSAAVVFLLAGGVGRAEVGHSGLSQGVCFTWLKTYFIIEHIGVSVAVLTTASVLAGSVFTAGLAGASSPANAPALNARPTAATSARLSAMRFMLIFISGVPPRGV